MIISPAKKMRVDQEYLAYQDLPRFLKEAERLMGQLRPANPVEVQRRPGQGKHPTVTAHGIIS